MSPFRSAGAVGAVRDGIADAADLWEPKGRAGMAFENLEMGRIFEVTRHLMTLLFVVVNITYDKTAIECYLYFWPWMIRVYHGTIGTYYIDFWWMVGEWWISGTQPWWDDDDAFQPRPGTGYSSGLIQGWFWSW